MLFRVELIPSWFLDLISKASKSGCRCKSVLVANRFSFTNCWCNVISTRLLSNTDSLDQAQECLSQRGLTLHMNWVASRPKILNAVVYTGRTGYILEEILQASEVNIYLNVLKT